MDSIKKRLNYWNQKVEEEHYFCSKCGYLFHNFDELRDFSNDNDYFSLDNEL